MKVRLRLVAVRVLVLARSRCKMGLCLRTRVRSPTGLTITVVVTVLAVTRIPSITRGALRVSQTRAPFQVKVGVRRLMSMLLSITRASLKQRAAHCALSAGEVVRTARGQLPLAAHSPSPVDLLRWSGTRGLVRER